MRLLTRFWRRFVYGSSADGAIQLSTRAVFDGDEFLIARLERAAQQREPNAIEQAWIVGRTKKSKQLAEVINFHGRR